MLLGHEVQHCIVTNGSMLSLALSMNLHRREIIFLFYCIEKILHNILLSMAACSASPSAWTCRENSIAYNKLLFLNLGFSVID